jgi:hypothetical protein
MDDRDKLLFLERLITDPEFNKLQNLSTSLNFFKITGIDSQEIKHSNTIAWFFDPLGSHNLGSLFFQRFIAQLFEEKQDYFNDQNINILELLLSDLDDMEVIRERENDIDILLKSKRNQFIICIENKVWSGLGDKQLDKYYEYIIEKYPSYNKKIFILISPSGYEVPGDKSKYLEKWTASSYENIVKILRSISELNIEQKIKYIIEDYIELLEKEHIVENTKLDNVLAQLCTKHKEAINLLLEYHSNIEQSQSVIKRIQEVFVETLQKLENEDKIICNKSSLVKYFLIFYTRNMNEYFPPLNDESGSWKEGSKYRYWIDLKRQSNKPRITLELGPLGQDPATIVKFNLIRKFVHKKEVSAADQYRQTIHWDIDIDWSDFSLDDIDEKYIQKEIIETLNKIFQWEIGLNKITK